MQNFSQYFLLKVGGIFGLVVFIMVSVASFAPKDFPVNHQFHIAQNTGLSRIADKLASERVISSPFLFKVVVTLLYGQGSISAGDYVFTTPENLWKVAGRLARGEQNLTPIRVTIPEGSTVQDIAWILMRQMPRFSAPYFLKIASEHEGYLFPDTYTFYPNHTEEQIFETLRKTFDTKLKSLEFDIELLGRSAEDVVIMASLLEREARGRDERAIIAGILWKRLDEGMLLQVDATLIYAAPRAPGDTSGFVSLDDTKVDSPYNTYKHVGLPPGPIANPGLESLKAAVRPLKSPYYYYLSDKEGKMHYAVTHDGHVDNKNRYLR